MIGRFDLSKTQKPVFDAHPEWFFTRANGEPAIYNGLYSTCINGEYYREHALTILAEALERYEVDGLFFNMFGNPSADYSGVPMGPCQCGACQARYRARYRQRRAGRGRRRLPDVHGRLRARGRGDDRGAHSPEAPARGVLDLHQGSHRRDHVRVEYGRWPRAAAVAVFRQRQREPFARLRARQARDQPVHELRGLPVAICLRAAGRRSSYASIRTWRTAGLPPSPSSGR